MNIFSIILAVCGLSLFSAFIFDDISIIRTVLIGALVVYTIGLVFELKFHIKGRTFRQNAPNL